jgi:hypothetical protein
VSIRVICPEYATVDAGVKPIFKLYVPPAGMLIGALVLLTSENG